MARRTSGPDHDVVLDHRTARRYGMGPAEAIAWAMAIILGFGTMETVIIRLLDIVAP